MSLSLPIINNIITEKITALNNTLNSNDAFYKVCILNLSSQLNLLIDKNEELVQRIEHLENSRIIHPLIIKNKVDPLYSQQDIDIPPGLAPPETQTNSLKKISNTGVTSNDNWCVVRRKKTKRRNNTLGFN